MKKAPRSVEIKKVEVFLVENSPLSRGFIHISKKTMLKDREMKRFPCSWVCFFFSWGSGAVENTHLEQLLSTVKSTQYTGILFRSDTEVPSEQPKKHAPDELVSTLTQSLPEVLPWQSKHRISKNVWSMSQASYVTAIGEAVSPLAWFLLFLDWMCCFLDREEIQR